MRGWVCYIQVIYSLKGYIQINTGVMKSVMSFSVLVKFLIGVACNSRIPSQASAATFIIIIFI